MNNFRNLIKSLEVETICLGSDAQERLEDCGPDEEITVAENDGFQTVLVSDPGIYFPELGICAMNAMVCNNDDGMSDWAGTALFTVSEMGFRYAYIEQDPMLLTIRNCMDKDASQMQAFVLEGVADKIITPSSRKTGYRKDSIFFVNEERKSVSEKEYENEF